VREGRIERTIRKHLHDHPDEAFTTEHLAAVCYPDTLAISRKHRVAVIRAAGKVLNSDPDWQTARSWRRGQTIYFNAASVMSAAQAESLKHWIFETRESLTQNALERLAEDDETYRAEVEEEVQNHIAVRDAATPEEAERLKAQIRAKLDCEVAFGLVRPPPRRPRPPPRAPAWEALAAKARALMTENDPEVIRAGLAELADTLDGL